jgi:hypothetical protein
LSFSLSTIRDFTGQASKLKKKVTDFPVPSRDVTSQTLPSGKNLINPGQGEFGYWHPGWGRENR